MHPVIALKRCEATLSRVHADDRFRIDPKALHAIHIRDHVGLADQHAFRVDLTQMITQGRLAHPQREAIPGRSVAAYIAPGVEAHPGRAADRRLDIGLVEPHAHGGQPVNMRRVEMGVAVAGQIIPAQLVRHDPQYVT